MPSGYADSGALVVAADRDDAESPAPAARLPARPAGSSPNGSRPRAARRPGAGPLAARSAAPSSPPRTATPSPRRGGGGAGRRAAGRPAASCVTGVEVDGLLTSGGAVTGVRTAAGDELRADTVLVAAGAWSSQGGLTAGGRLAAGQAAEGPAAGAARARGPHAAAGTRLVRTPRCYVVPRADGQPWWWARPPRSRASTPRSPPTACSACWRPPTRCCPTSRELELVRARAGLRPATRDNRARDRRGRATPGLAWATGHGRNGVLLAPLTARQRGGRRGCAAARLARAAHEPAGRAQRRRARAAGGRDGGRRRGGQRRARRRARAWRWRWTARWCRAPEWADDPAGRRRAGRGAAGGAGRMSA